MTQEVRIAIRVPSLKDSIDFYQHVFRLPLGEHWDFHGQGQILPAGEAVIELLDEQHTRFVNAAEGDPAYDAPVRLAIGVSNVAEVLERVPAYGGQVVWGPQVTPWGDTNARIKTPEGQIVTVFQVSDAS